MTVRRNLTNSGVAPATWAADASAAINYLLGLDMARLQSVGGSADAITASLDEGTGFSNGTIQDGARLVLTAAAACIGPTTLNIDTGGALAVRDKAGNALAADAWASGDDLLLAYVEGSPSVWRLVGVTSNAPAAPPSSYPFIYAFDDDGTLTFSEDSETIILGLGGGGPGGAARGNAESRSQGGNPGAFGIKYDSPAAATVYTITVAQAKTGPTAPAGAANTATGDDGDASTISDGDTLNCVANGGKAGQAANAATTLAQQAAAVATGFDHNFDGGRSGAVSARGSSGGAAPGIFADGNDSGAISTNTSRSGGAGLSGPSADNTDSGAAAIALFGVAFGVLSMANTKGGDADTVAGENGEDFAGGGATYIGSSANSDAGDGGIGGGGGGAASAGSNQAKAGDGGPGRVWVLSTKPAVQA